MVCGNNSEEGWEDCGCGCGGEKIYKKKKMMMVKKKKRQETRRRSAGIDINIISFFCVVVCFFVKFFSISLFLFNQDEIIVVACLTS